MTPRCLLVVLPLLLVLGLCSAKDISKRCGQTIKMSTIKNPGDRILVKSHKKWDSLDYDTDESCKSKVKARNDTMYGIPFLTKMDNIYIYRTRTRLYYKNQS